MYMVVPDIVLQANAKEYTCFSPASYVPEDETNPSRSIYSMLDAEVDDVSTTRETYSVVMPGEAEFESV